MWTSTIYGLYYFNLTRISRNVYEGQRDKAKGGRFEGGRRGWVGRESVGVKMETIVLEQQ